ncbi:MAG TPA: xanthine dehydrogenase family protein molybdopterin-binding subunit [Ktedonobacteraceae bacterium]
MNKTLIPVGLERRREDYTLITGQARYVDDLRAEPGRPAILHMVVVRSPYAHAEVHAIDLEAARTLPGVVAAFAAQELVEAMPGMDAIPVPRKLNKPLRKPLATQRVRYVGDPVAVVVAEDLSVAMDARDLVEVDYTPLPAVADPEAALAPGAPLLYTDLGSNVVFDTQIGGGDLDAAFAQADKTTRLRVVNQRIAPSSLEPRACLFDFNPASGELRAWLSSQAIYSARDTLAKYLGLERENIHVFNAEVGGAFGAKSAFVGEEVVAAALAVRLGRPVKWIESRSENLQAQTQGRGQVNYIEAGYQANGRLLALRVHTIADLGAFLANTTTMVPVGTASMLNGPYRIQAMQSQIIGAFTNKVPTGAYRGAGRPEAAYILERTMDRIAQETGLDPVEVRRRNLIAPEAFPYTTLVGSQYDSGNYQAALEKVIEIGDYAGWRAKQQERRQQGNSHLLGLGLATYLEISGGAMSGPGMPREAATVRVRRDGSILVQSGVATNGQGHFTAFTQIVASIFSVPGTQVEVQMNDSALPAFGIGTFGSRTTQVSGTAVHLAAEATREKVLALAAQHLEASPDDLELANSQVSVRGVPSRVISLGELAALVEAQPDLIEREQPNPVNGAPIEGLASWRDFSPASATFCSGAHLAVVEIDSETGELHILRYIAVDDGGNILNQYLADAQVHGAIAQGIGQALYEETIYGSDGQLLSSTLMDYTMPVAEQIPAFLTAFVETPSPINPLGAKGVGEGGTTGAPPAVVNAAIDALAPLGIRHLDMPLKPEKIWAKIASARSGNSPEAEPVLPAIFNARQANQEGGTSTFA